MASSDEPQSLRAVFEEAETKRKALESSPDATSPTYGEEIDSALSLYGRVLNQISAVSLFSANEGVEDVGTSSLPYLLVDYYMAELVQRTPYTGAVQRKTTIRRARAAYERLLAITDGYGLVTGPYAKLLERYRDDEEHFAVAAASSGDPNAKRDAKIASFRAEKALKEKLEMLRRNPRYLDNGDEEIVRELYLTNVTYAIHSTFQALDSLNRELPLLAMAPDPATMPTKSPSADDHDPTLRLDQPFRSNLNRGGPLLSQQGKPLQPFTLVGSRAELGRGVFRSGHNLPTMSIDEYLAEERRQGNIIEGGAEPPKPVVDEDDMDAMDRETYKAREWDEFKDHNPRGAGNTLNMG